MLAVTVGIAPVPFITGPQSSFLRKSAACTSIEINLSQFVSLAESVFRVAGKNGTHVAIDTGQQRIGYAQLRPLISAHAVRLQNFNIDRESVIAIDVDHPISNVFLALACSLIGCRWVHATRAAMDYQHLRITHVICDAAAPYPQAANILRLDPTWNILPKTKGGLADFEFEGYASANSVWSIGQSSGTTGTPKFMEITAHAAAARMEYPFDIPDGETLRGASLAHPLSAIGLYAILRYWMRGGTWVLGLTFDILAKNQTNVVSGSPNQLSKLCREYNGNVATKIHSAIITGGKPNPYLMEMYLKRFDVVRNAYGSTEAGLMCSKLLTTAESDTSAGFPPKDAIVEIVDSADLQLPNETEGIVRLRTPGMVRSYIGDAKATAEAFRDGWFYPGDTGMFDENSALHITGRINDQFNFGGIKINAVAIDEVMQAVSGVHDAVCFAQSTPDMVGELNAIIVLAPNGDKIKSVSAVRAAIHDKYGPSRVPAKIFVCPSAPRNDAGKAQRQLAPDAVKSLEPVP